MKYVSHSKLMLQVASLASALLLLMVHTAYAGDKGLEIAKKVYYRPTGDTVVAKINMILQSRNGRERRRQFYSYHKEYPENRDKILVRFTLPSDVKDTAMITYNYPVEESDQWLYLPEGELTRRISGDRKGGRFVNSDITFEDMRDRMYDKDTHTYLGQEEVEGALCDKIESIPVSADNSSYSKRISWIHPQSLIPIRVDYYTNNPNKPEKRYSVQKIDKIQGFWTVIDSEVVNYDLNHKTFMRTENVVYNVDLPEFLFEQAIFKDPAAEVKYRAN